MAGHLARAGRPPEAPPDGTRPRAPRRGTDEEPAATGVGGERIRPPGRLAECRRPCAGEQGDGLEPVPRQRTGRVQRSGRDDAEPPVVLVGGEGTPEDRDQAGPRRMVPAAGRHVPGADAVAQGGRGDRYGITRSQPDGDVGIRGGGRLRGCHQLDHRPRRRAPGPGKQRPLGRPQHGVQSQHGKHDYAQGQGPRGRQRGEGDAAGEGKPPRRGGHEEDTG